jgi:hypothetical protein
MSNRRTKVEFEHFLQIKGFCKTAIGIVRRQELRDRTHWAIKARKFDGAVWTWIELCFCQSLLKPGVSQLVYSTTVFTGALPGTTQASWCSSASVADAKSFRAPAILFASEAAG